MFFVSFLLSLSLLSSLALFHFLSPPSFSSLYPLSFPPLLPLYFTRLPFLLLLPFSLPSPPPNFIFRESERNLLFCLRMHSLVALVCALTGEEPAVSVGWNDPGTAGSRQPLCLPLLERSLWCSSALSVAGPVHPQLNGVEWE